MRTRNTVQRQIVLDAVQSLHTHPTAEEIYSIVSAHHPSISKATVYRNLSQLAEQEEILRVAMPTGADRFDFNLQPHMHLRCRCCGCIVDVQMDPPEDLIGLIRDAHGSVVERYDLLFEGVCKNCRV